MNRTRPLPRKSLPLHLALLVLLVTLLSACGAPAAPAAPATALPAAEAPATAASAAAAPAGPAAQAASGMRTFVIVPEQSKAIYLVNEEFFAGALAKFGINAGENHVEGSTQAISGQLQLNLDDGAVVLGDNSFTVQMNTLTTERDMRDTWIREDGPRFNDYPEATFTATAIEGAPPTYTEGEEVHFELMGDLTVREVTKPVTFDVTAKLAGDTLTGVATTQALLTDFGIEPPSFANTLTVANDLGIRVEFSAKEQ